MLHMVIGLEQVNSFEVDCAQHSQFTFHISLYNNFYLFGPIYAFM